MRLLLILLFALVSAPMVAPTAHAQDYEDLDDPDANTKKKKTKDKKERKSRDFSSEEVREITKGTYAKTNIGGWSYFGNFAGFVRAGTSLALAVGRDFVDNERSTISGELTFFQGIHNGTHWQTQATDFGCIASGGAAPCVQGDLRTYTLLALIEYSTYPSRRIGLGLRAGGGVLLSPLLMDKNQYESFVAPYLGDPDYHKVPHPAIVVGPTFEYYTKMSHFSVGTDIDVIYAIGFDIGASMTATLKYTF
jgi:hypothetical protein